MQTRFLTSTIMLGMLLGAGLSSAAQDAAAKPSQKKEITAYHLDFSINELEDGKKLNSRHYSMNLTDGGGGKDLNIGTRVPVQTEEGKFQYLDVGTHISAHMSAWASPTTLDVNAEVNSFATPDEPTHGGRPLLRQVRISGSTAIVLDKPMVIGSVDDPASKRTFQLEVTVSKLK